MYLFSLYFTWIVNWDAMSFFAWLFTFIGGVIVLVFSRIRESFSFYLVLTKKDGEHNYYLFHEKMMEVYEDYKYNNSPQVKELEAKIAKLEEEKELNEREGIGEIRKMVQTLAREVQELKILGQR